MLVEKKMMFFTQMFKSAKSKFEVVTIFLAILELIKMKEIIVRQASQFGEIEIIRDTETIVPTVPESAEAPENNADKPAENING